MPGHKRTVAKADYAAQAPQDLIQLQLDNAKFIASTRGQGKIGGVSARIKSDLFLNIYVIGLYLAYQFARAYSQNESNWTTPATQTLAPPPQSSHVNKDAIAAAVCLGSLVVMTAVGVISYMCWDSHRKRPPLFVLTHLPDSPQRTNSVREDINEKDDFDTISSQNNRYQNRDVPSESNTTQNS